MTVLIRTTSFRPLPARATLAAHRATLAGHRAPLSGRLAKRLAVTPILALALAALAVASVAPPLAAQSTFEKITTGPIVTTTNESRAMAFGDADGDGDADLYVANEGPNQFFVNQGGAQGGTTGDFVEDLASPLTNGNQLSTAAQWADTDGDGDLDLYVCNGNALNNTFFRNQGGLQGGTEGVFLQEFTGAIVSDLADCRAAVFGDLDADLDLDLVVAVHSGDNLIFVNQGGVQGGTQGDFTKLTVGPAVTDGGASNGVALGDIDNDGDLDLFVSNGSDQTNFLYTNGGSGVFTKMNGFHPMIFATDSQAGDFADIDDDGDLDLVVGNFFDDNELYLNQGGDQGGVAGQFSPVTTGPVVNDGHVTLHADFEDWDADGDPDLYLSGCCNADNRMYTNDGNGEFTQVATGIVVMDGGYSHKNGWADIDGDGDLDLAVANTTAAGDNENFLYRNDLGGTFVSVAAAGANLLTDPHETFDITWVDFDDDGYNDLFLATADDTVNALYRNLGGVQGGIPGTFQRVLNDPLVNGLSQSQDAAWADFDADGDLDVVVVNRFGDDNELYFNQGGAQGGTLGTFVEAVNSPVSMDGRNSRAVDVADIDADGDLDIFVANSNDQGNLLYWNTGGIQGGVLGVFFQAASDPTQTDLGNNYGAHFGDADGDGDPDLFVANRAGNNFLYVNQGGAQAGLAGTYQADTVGPVGNDGGNSFSGTWGDIDGDGDLDLFVVNSGEVNFLYRNLGGAQGGTEGTFVRVLGGPEVAATNASRRAEWVDVEADGDLDLLVPNASGQGNELYLNEGDGTFIAVLGGPVVADGGNSRTASFGDFDGDGDPDLAVGNQGEATFLYENISPNVDPWTNLGSPLAGVQGDPILNANGTLEANTQVTFQVANGAPSSSYTLVVGLSAIGIPFKQGTLWPSPDLLINGLPLDGTGFAILGSTFPAGVPAGIDFVFQAWILDAAAPKGLSATNGLQATTP